MGTYLQGIDIGEENFINNLIRAKREVSVYFLSKYRVQRSKVCGDLTTSMKMLGL
jgi:hypothetical protein